MRGRGTWGRIDRVPEGHSIHRLAQRHDALLVGDAVRASSPQGRFSDGAAHLDGRVLTETDAWGKHLFHRYEDLWLHVHLGLFGRFRDGRGLPPEPRGAVRLLLAGPDAWAELRGPVACELMADPDRLELLDRLGPDPLRADGDAETFVVRVGRGRAPIGTLLMNQAVIAGVGNVYRAEVLWRSGTSPFMPGRDVEPSVVRTLWDDLAVLMRAGVRSGRIVTTDPLDRERPAGRPRRSDAHYVYGRTDRPCRRCGAPVRSAQLASRTVFWCPTCQPD